MPSYDYECGDCKKNFTVYMTVKEMDAQPKIKCPHCDSDNVKKKFSAFFAKTSRKS